MTKQRGTSYRFRNARGNLHPVASGSMDWSRVECRRPAKYNFTLDQIARAIANPRNLQWMRDAMQKFPSKNPRNLFNLDDLTYAINAGDYPIPVGV